MQLKKNNFEGIATENKGGEIMKRFLFVLLVSLVLVLTACSVTTTTPEKINDTSQTQQTAKQQIFKIGDKVKMGDLAITLNSAQLVLPDEWNQPTDSNNQFLFVDATIENLGNQSVVISSLMMFKLVDKDGREQNIAIHTKQKGQLDGELGPSRKMTGQIVFEVPKTSKLSDFEFIFEPDLLGFGQAIFKLEK